ncbi:MAG TPA: TA0938 family protein [Thermoplasmata archaeon]|nr:TA0938 family protein [Thermoplasmata archaeon]
MRINYSGCAICDSTWGDHWEEVDGERRFFCCALCARQFRALLARIRATTGWSTLEELVIAGDRRGRTCTVSSRSGTARFSFAFNSEGALREFGSA